MAALWLTTCVGAARAAPGELRFGTGVPTGQILDAFKVERLRRAGGSVAREGLKWAAVQRRPGGSYDWARYDRTVARLARAGIAFLPILIGSPPYAAEEEAEPPTTAAGKRGFERFVKAAVNRYGRDGTFWRTLGGRTVPYLPITAWEVWNEPNIARFWTGCRPDVREYYGLLRSSHRAIKSEDARASVVLAGMPEAAPARTRIPMSRFLDELYELPGARRLFDVVAAHPYAATVAGVDRALRRSRRVMKRNGDAATPLWITEVGWASSGPPGHPLVKGEAEQGRLLAETFELLERRRAAYKLGTVLVYRFQDPVGAAVAKGAGGRWEDGAGMFRKDGEPKPAWRAFADAAGGSAGLGGLLLDEAPINRDAPRFDRDPENCR